MSVHEIPAAGLTIREIEKEVGRLLTRADQLCKIVERRRQQLADEEVRAIELAAQRTRRELRRTA